MKTKLAPLLLLVLSSSTFAQGPLTPPPTGGNATGVAGPLGPSGEPMPTMKTLHQIEPRHDLLNGPWGVPMFVNISDPAAHYIINKAGSYYLSADLAIIKSAGIVIAADNVTLDLRGFTLQQDIAATGTTIGIRLATGVKGVKIHGGTFSGLSTGISTTSVLPGDVSAQLEKLAFIGCGTAAVKIEAPAFPAPNSNIVQMSDCVAQGCGKVAPAASMFHLEAQAQVSHCTVSDCTSLADGLSVGAGSRVSGTSIVRSSGAGAAIALSSGSVAEHCTVDGWNGSCGIQGTDASLSHCNAKAMTAATWSHETAAFSIDGGTVSDCHASLSTIAWGFDVRHGIVTACSARAIHGSSQSTSLWGGFRLRAGTMATDCVSSEHGGGEVQGISAERGGIGFMLLGEGARLRSSSVSEVQGACILSESRRALIEGNHTSGGHTGIWLGGDDSQTVDRNIIGGCQHGLTIIVQKCRVRQNVFMDIGTQVFSIASGNYVASILQNWPETVITGAGTGQGYTSTDPWANTVQ